MRQTTNQTPFGQQPIQVYDRVANDLGAALNTFQLDQMSESGIE
jgi:hypothetical protein